jgi:hypothetical protein
MSDRKYSVEFENVAVAAAQDFFELDPGAEKPIEIVGLILGQFTEVASNVGEDEFLRYRIIRGHTTSGSGGTAATARPLDPATAASGATAEVNNTTIASAGTAINLHSDTFNVRTGLQLWWPENYGPASSGADLLVVRLLAAPADSVTMSGTLYFREV